MANQIVINYIVNGTFPINVYIADIYGNYKSLIGTVTSAVPPQVFFDVTIPAIFNNAPQIMLILEDNDGCEIFKILDCVVPSLQVCLIFQDGSIFETQEGDRFCAQQLVTEYLINVGNAVESTSCSDTNYTVNVYSAVDGWGDVISLYYDPQMSLPFVGGNLWYKSENSNILLQIKNDGYVNNKFTCP